MQIGIPRFTLARIMLAVAIVADLLAMLDFAVRDRPVDCCWAAWISMSPASRLGYLLRNGGDIALAQVILPREQPVALALLGSFVLLVIRSLRDQRPYGATRKNGPNS